MRRRDRRARWILPALAAAFVASFPILSATANCHIATFEGDPYSTGEGAGKVTITVSNNGGGGNGTIDYKTVNGSAKAGQDYVAKIGTLAFTEPTGQLSFAVTIIDDKKDEQDETFRVELSNPQGCFSTIQEDSATVTIKDNDEKAVAQPTPTPTPTKTSSPKPKPSTASASPSPSSPSPTTSASPIAAADSADGGLSGGAIGGIVAATVVLGGAAAFWVRRRFLT